MCQISNCEPVTATESYTNWTLVPKPSQLTRHNEEVEELTCTMDKGRSPGMSPNTQEPDNFPMKTSKCSDGKKIDEEIRRKLQ